MQFNIDRDNNIDINVIDDNMINYSLDPEQQTNIDVITSDTVGIEFGENSNIDFEMSERAGGTTNYNLLSNKPQINEVTLIGNKNSEQLHLQDEMDYLTNLEIERLLDSFV